MGYEHPEAVPDDLLRAYLTPVLGTPEAARQFERVLVSLDARDLLDAEPALKELTVPTLVVWGTGDEFFDLSWAYWLRDTIPGVTEVVEVPGRSCSSRTSGPRTWSRTCAATGQRQRFMLHDTRRTP